MQQASAGVDSPRPAVGPALVAGLVFLVAFNLRPLLTSVGPVLPQIGADAGLSEGFLGLLGAVPVLAFAAMSPFIHRISKSVGIERTVFIALIVLAAGIAVRSFAGNAGLWIGTIIAGCAIASANVLLPVIVRHDFSRHISRTTGIYTTCMGAAAAIASAVVVPLANVFGWQTALALWAIPPLIVAVLWFQRAHRPTIVPPPIASTERRHRGVWTQSTAWFLTIFMGLQSTTFYTLITWLPTIAIANGVPPEQAGFQLFLYQTVGIGAGLAIPFLLRRGSNQIAAALASTIPSLIGVLGFLLVPALSPLWAIVTGLGSGASLVVALTMIGYRGRNHQETTQLSGMAQSMGYLLAAAGPVLAGLVAGWTGSWIAPLTLLSCLIAVQFVIAIFAGRDRRPSIVAQLDASGSAD